MFDLRSLRKDSGLTQSELAETVGVTQSLVAMWERGAAYPSALKLPDIADALGCTIDALYGREPPGAAPEWAPTHAEAGGCNM